MATTASKTISTIDHPAAVNAKTQKSLAEDIFGTTRNIHARINKLIAARLPLALPPRATDTGEYISGMLHFMPIYVTFERLWENIIDTAETGNHCDGENTATSGFEGDDMPPFSSDGEYPASEPAASQSVRTVLQELYLPGLARSSRLRADIIALTGWSDGVLDDQLKTISSVGRLGEFISHIKRVVHKKPHVLIAYSYILYMALFAGGRFIRASFESAGDEFWENVPPPIKPTLQPCEPDMISIRRRRQTRKLNREATSQTHKNSDTSHSLPLSFWRFSTDQDGEDLKREYKAKLLELEDNLTAQERHDINQEAICIFENMGLILLQLDEVWKKQELETSPSAAPRPSLAVFLKNSIASRLRDSLVVTRERSAKNQPRPSPRNSNSSEKGNHEVLRDDEKPGDDACHGAGSCPGIPKSMRFAKSLPLPPREHPPVRKQGGYCSRLQVGSQRLHRIPAAGLVLAMTLGLLLLWTYLSRRVTFRGAG